MGYRRITRGRKASSSKGKGNGNGKSNGTSKFKTRYRKMRGGNDNIKSSVEFEKKASGEKPLCVNVQNTGDKKFNRPYDMHTDEQEFKTLIKQGTVKKDSVVLVPPVSGFSGLIRTKTKLTNGLREEYVDNKRLTFGYFKGDFYMVRSASLYGIGAIKFVTDNIQGCVNQSPDICSSAFLEGDSLVSGQNTKSVFFGSFQDSKHRLLPTYVGVKDGNGLFFDVEDDGTGRLFICQWSQTHQQGSCVNGIGIEVNFTVPRKDSRTVEFSFKNFGTYTMDGGIYYGYFRHGKRYGYGIYYNVKTGTETYLCYLDDGKCVVMDSFLDGEAKQIFRSRVIASLKVVSASTGEVLTTLLQHKNYFKKYLEKFVEGMGASRLGGVIIEANAQYNKYRTIFKDFVKFCFDLFDYVHEEYETVRTKDVTDAAAAKAEEEANQAARERVKEMGMEVRDLPKEQQEQKELEDCVVKLEKKHYIVKSPKVREEEEKAKLTSDQERLLTLEKKETVYDTAKQRADLLALLGAKKLLGRGSSRDSRVTEPSFVPQPWSPTIRRSRQRIHSPGLAEITSVLFPSPESDLQGQGQVQSPILPQRISSSPDVSRRSSSHSPGGGGKRTRKNMRMSMSMRRVKSRTGTRRSRRGGSQCGRM
jgi:hypothetical protein